MYIVHTWYCQMHTVFAKGLLSLLQGLVPVVLHRVRFSCLQLLYAFASVFGICLKSHAEFF